MKKTNRIKEQAEQLSAAAKSVVIEQPNSFSVALEIQGLSDLIQNNFAQKSVEAMLKKHMGLSVQREKKKPRELLEQAMVKNTNGKICLSPTCFKKAMLGAAGSVKLKKTDLRTAIFIRGNSVPITYEKMVPRMDICRLAGVGRTPDVRFRPSFQNWKARMIIQFSDTLSVQSVVDLLNRAGCGGVGEWRPQRDGTFGTFKVVRHISTPREIGEIEHECSYGLVPVVIPDWALDLDIDPSIADAILNGKSEEVATA